MKIINLADLPDKQFAKLETDLAKHKTLGQVLTWAKTQPEDNFIRTFSNQLKAMLGFRIC